MVFGGASGPTVGLGALFRNMLHPTEVPSSSVFGVLWKPPTKTAPLLATNMNDDDNDDDHHHYHAGDSVRVTFRNNGTDPLLLCWVDQDGHPHHFYSLKPTDVVTGPVTVDDHTERTCTGHAFILAHCPTLALHQQAVQNQSLTNATVIGGYRPLHVRNKYQNADSTYPLHIVTVQQRTTTVLARRGWWGSSCCGCLPPAAKTPKAFHASLRNGNEPDDNDDDNDEHDVDYAWDLSVSQGEMDPTPFDTTRKRYLKATVGGWPLRCETCWHGNDQEVKERLTRDLRNVVKCLPNQACLALQKDTYLWVNRSLRYGPAACPEQGNGLCFHPDPEWLRQNGCHQAKAECVELYDVKEYCDISRMWGTGGVLIHEFSHSYHYKVLPDGYDNTEILDCYNAAMKEGLYDCVRVHGSQGPTARAYACDNAMEYFAELSTAFLGGLDETEEFNKWYPFNRKQLKEHDPRAYALLKRLWQVDDA